MMLNAPRLITQCGFEFSAAHRLLAPHGEGQWHGHTYTVGFGVASDPAAPTGEGLSHRAWQHLLGRVREHYDYRNLNQQLPGLEPTLINVARALWDTGSAIQALAIVELTEQGGLTARVTPTTAQMIYTTEFAAAHRTYAPALSEADNRARYGRCVNVHGHNYRVEVALPLGVAPPLFAAEFDHKNLSADIAELQAHNVVTETLATLIARRVPEAEWVRVWETADFFAQYQPTTPSYRMGRRYVFHAAHRLHDPARSEAANHARYGPCASPDLHGHTYIVEVVVQGALDPITETVYDLVQLDALSLSVLQPLDHTPLEATVFRAQPSTLENVARYLWAQLAAALGAALAQVTVWESAHRQVMITIG